MTSWLVTVSWVGLLLVGAFFVLAPLLDVAGDASTGLPADHRAAFAAVSGIPWTDATRAAPGVARYVTLLEAGYAEHELTFALLFLAIVLVPLRRGEAWAWVASWAVLVAAGGYTLGFASHDPALLRQSLIATVGVPLLLLAQLPRLLRRRGAAG